MFAEQAYRFFNDFLPQFDRSFYVSGNLPFGYAPFNALLYFTYKEENSWYISTSIVFRSRSSSGLESLYSGETTGGKPISGEVKIPAYANWKIEGGYSLNDNISLFVR